MPRLSRRDLLSLLEFLRESYTIHGFEALIAHLLKRLPRIVECEAIAYNEYDPLRHRLHYVVEPREADVPGGAPALEGLLHEHPLLAYYQRTGDRRAIKFSDFLTRAQYHRLGLYNEFFRLAHPSIEDLMNMTFRPRPTLDIIVSLGRHSRNFAERDRMLLNLQTLERLDRGVILLRRDGRVGVATAPARRWLSEYFDRASALRNGLPEALERWVRGQEQKLCGADDAPPPRNPLVIEREGKRLLIRLLSDAGQSLLLLEEQRTDLDPRSLEPLGLSRREAEVLAWVAQGKTDEVVARILGISPFTVQKHLQHVYSKLGVETRTAAAALALTAPPDTANPGI